MQFILLFTFILLDNFQDAGRLIKNESGVLLIYARIEYNFI